MLNIHYVAQQNRKYTISKCYNRFNLTNGILIFYEIINKDCLLGLGVVLTQLWLYEYKYACVKTLTKPWLVCKNQY